MRGLTDTIFPHPLPEGEGKLQTGVPTGNLVAVMGPSRLSIALSVRIY